MSKLILKIIDENRTISMESVIDELSAFLIEAPEKGVPFIELVFKNPDRKLDVYFSSYYLSFLKNLSEDKNRFAKNIIENHENLIPSLQRFIYQLNEKNITSLIEKASKSRDTEIFESAIYEIATYYPELLRKYKINIEESAKKGLLPGSDEEIVKSLVQKYEKAHKSTYLNDVALIRTDEALEAMFEIFENATSKEKLEIEMLIENMGVFPAPDDRRASMYFQKNYRGFVVARTESPHHMGAGFEGQVPCCSKSGIAADRIVTLKKSALDFAIGGSHDPSFFWFNGEVPIEGIFVQFSSDGTRSLNTPQVSPEGTNLIPKPLSLGLEEFPVQHGRGIFALPGYNNHQVGGYIPTMRFERFPTCPICNKPMRLLVSIDGGPTAYGRIPIQGILYGYWCEEDSVSCTKIQTH
jgi:hypothetical protein